MSINTDKLMSIFETLKKDLGEGFLATDVWNTANARPLVKDHEYNKHPKAITLFNEATGMLGKTLEESDYPGLGNYYLINLEKNYLVVVISIESFQQFILVDLSKTPMGIVMSVALPNLLSSLSGLEKKDVPVETEAAAAPSENQAEKDSPEAGKTKKLRIPTALKEFFDSLTGPTFHPPEK